MIINVLGQKWCMPNLGTHRHYPSLEKLDGALYQSARNEQSSLQKPWQWLPFPENFNTQSKLCRNVC